MSASRKTNTAVGKFENMISCININDPNSSRFQNIIHNAYLLEFPYLIYSKTTLCINVTFCDRHIIKPPTFTSAFFASVIFPKSSHLKTQIFSLLKSMVCLSPEGCLNPKNQNQTDSRVTKVFVPG